VIVKGEHRWIFQWAPGEERSVARYAVELARRPNSGFDIIDATTVTRHVLRRAASIKVLPSKSARSSGPEAA
jgi:hypothetical protein